MFTINRMSIEDARILIDGAVQKSREIQVPMCIAVTDESGNLIAFERMDGAKVISISIAMDKAFTASAARNSTKHYNQVAVPGQPAFGLNTSNRGRFSIVGGGIPVMVNDVVVGGIGISSGSADQDHLVAEGALEHFHAHVRSGAPVH